MNFFFGFFGFPEKKLPTNSETIVQPPPFTSLLLYKYLLRPNWGNKMFEEGDVESSCLGQRRPGPNQTGSLFSTFLFFLVGLSPVPRGPSEGPLLLRRNGTGPSTTPTRIASSETGRV